MKERTELNITLRIAQQDILAAINHQFKSIQDDVEHIVAEEFNSFNFEEIVKCEVQKSIKGCILGAVRDYIQYGEGGKLITKSIQSLLKETIVSVVNRQVAEELNLSQTVNS